MSLKHPSMICSSSAASAATTAITSSTPGAHVFEFDHYYLVPAAEIDISKVESKDYCAGMTRRIRKGIDGGKYPAFNII